MTPQAMLRKDLKTGKAIETLQHRHYATIAAIIAELPRTARYDNGAFRASLEPQSSV